MTSPCHSRTSAVVVSPSAIDSSTQQALAALLRNDPNDTSAAAAVVSGGVGLSSFVSVPKQLAPVSPVTYDGVTSVGPFSRSDVLNNSILFVDDEPLIGKLAARFLSQLGTDVFFFSRS